jgi:phosphoribosylamine--glycine ligase
MNVLGLLETDFNKISQQIIDNKLKSTHYKNSASVCTYIVPKGYPSNPMNSEPVKIDGDLDSDLYYASVYRTKRDIRTTKSRTIALVGYGKNLKEAKKKVDADLPKIKGNLFYRKDIGVFP